MAKKTAREKMAVKKEPKRVLMDKAWAGMQPEQMMFVATPQIVDAYIRSISHGQTVTIPEMRDALAERENCAGTCPMSSAIFVRMVAEAALEDLADGKQVSEIAPFWRMITSRDKMVKKLKIDPDWIDQQRAMEAG